MTAVPGGHPMASKAPGHWQRHCHGAVWLGRAMSANCGNLCSISTPSGDPILRTLPLILVLSSVLLTLGSCGEASQEVQAQRRTTMESLKDAMSKAGALLKMEKGELVQKLKGSMTDLDSRSAALKAKMAGFGADAQTRLDAALSSLQSRRAEFASALKDLESAAPEQVEALKKKAADAFTSMLKSMGEAEEIGR